jgi:hypothetical protein
MLAASASLPARTHAWKLGIILVVLGLLAAAVGVPLGAVGTILIGVVAIFLLEPGRGFARPQTDAQMLARQARWEAGWLRGR